MSSQFVTLLGVVLVKGKQNKQEGMDACWLMGQCLDKSSKTWLPSFEKPNRLTKAKKEKKTRKSQVWRGNSVLAKKGTKGQGKTWLPSLRKQRKKSAKDMKGKKRKWKEKNGQGELQAYIRPRKWRSKMKFCFHAFNAKVSLIACNKWTRWVMLHLLGQELAKKTSNKENENLKQQNI